MRVERRMFLLTWFAAAALLVVAGPSVHGQVNKEKPQGQLASEPERESLEQFKLKLKQLQLQVETQQRALAEMQKRLEEMEVKARVVAFVSTSTTDGKGTGSGQAAFELNRLSNNSAASQDKTKPQDKAAVVAGWDKDKGHAFLRSPDGAFETTIGGYAQLDYHGYQSGNHPPNTFLIRRARLGVEGKVARYFDFKLEGDFSDAATPLRDFYVNIHRIDEFQLRFGQFRVPISLPTRSPGLMASGVLSKGAFEYQVGAFNGKGLLAPNNNGTPETAIRLRFTPWKNRGDFVSKGLSFGGAFTQGRTLGGTSVRGMTESRSFTFFAPDAINGKYIRANGEVTWLLGPAALRAEYDQTNQRRDNLGAGGGNLPGVVAKGYTAQVTYVLTGEDKPDAASVAVKNNLFGDGNGKPGFGAWELKFRYANLQIANGTAKSNRAESFFFGPNWYLNRFVRYVLDLGFERFKDPARSPKPGDKNFFVVLSRVQVAF